MYVYVYTYRLGISMTIVCDHESNDNKQWLQVSSINPSVSTCGSEGVFATYIITHANTFMCVFMICAYIGYSYQLHIAVQSHPYNTMVESVDKHTSDS